MCSSSSAELTADVNNMIGYLRVLGACVISGAIACDGIGYIIRMIFSFLGSVIERGNVNFTIEELQSLKWLSDVLKQIVRCSNLMY